MANSTLHRNNVFLRLEPIWLGLVNLPKLVFAHMIAHLYLHLHYLHSYINCITVSLHGVMNSHPLPEDKFYLSCKVLITVRGKPWGRLQGRLWERCGQGGQKKQRAKVQKRWKCTERSMAKQSSRSTNSTRSTKRKKSAKRKECTRSQLDELKTKSPKAYGNT